MTQDVPTLYDWTGGAPALQQLTTVFYKKVLRDPLLEPLFRNMAPDHPAHVATFIGEVFGGPKAYTRGLGRHREMIRHHLDRHLTEEQRRRWAALLVDAADETGIPDDPEFRSAFIAYVEWGTRLAKQNSNGVAESDLADEPMPEWGWGVPGGPYRPADG